MKFTGERMIPEYNQSSEIYLEHVNRYVFASRFVLGKNVLDIACGSGYGTKIIAQSGATQVTGVDIDSDSISYCQEKYGNEIKFIVGSAISIPVEANSMDVVISFETVEHLNGSDQVVFLSEIKRVLKSSGVLIMSTPNVLMSDGKNPFHLKELTFKEYQDFLDSKFHNTKIFYQNNVEGNYIFAKDTLADVNLSLRRDHMGVSKLDLLSADDSLFFISVSCDVDIPAFLENFAILNDSEIIRLKSDIATLRLAEENYQNRIKSTDDIVKSHAQWIQNLEKEKLGLQEKVKDLEKKLKRRGFFK